MRNLFTFLFVIVLCSQKIHSQNAQEIEILLNILQCMQNRNENIIRNTTEMINSFNNTNPYKIQKIYDFLKQNLELVGLCTHNFYNLPKYMKRQIIYSNFDDLKNFNWKKYVDCLKNHNRRDESLDTIISLINDKNYYNASVEEIKLLRNGNIPAMHCEKNKYESKDINLFKNIKEDDRKENIRRCSSCKEKNNNY